VFGRRAVGRRCHHIELQRSKPEKGGSLPPFSLFTPSTRQRRFAADVKVAKPAMGIRACPIAFGRRSLCR
jgi:hypothetical protein